MKNTPLLKINTLIKKIQEENNMIDNMNSTITLNNGI
ncbi:hypothetical protein J2Z25_000841 [Clostridium tertium]|nr:hypothetical protein [Clostridium tertium]